MLMGGERSLLIYEYENTNVPIREMRALKVALNPCAQDTLPSLASMVQIPQNGSQDHIFLTSHFTDPYLSLSFPCWEMKPSVIPEELSGYVASPDAKSRSSIEGCLKLFYRCFLRQMHIS